MNHHYDLRKEPDGTWTVLDVNTGRPGETGSRTMVGMQKEDADELASFLNCHQEQHRQEAER